MYSDPLEVTRTTSNDSITSSIPDYNSTIFECDYDLNPTVLYQAIEAKQWDYAISLFTDKANDVDDEEEASATWVVRKEVNGKLRWRLLPLHASLIFGAPLGLVELLLVDYAKAAQCKDDRGMLPLHLAFRNEATWDVIDELLTAYPQAIFVRDRKGRTPLKCCVSRRLQHSNNANQGGAIQSVNSTTTSSSGFYSSRGPDNNYHSDESSSTFGTIASVLQLYAEICVSGERNRVEQEARIIAQKGMVQVHESHHRTLVQLRTEWEIERSESKHRTSVVELENRALKNKIKNLERDLQLRDEFEKDTNKKMNLLSLSLHQANERVKANNPTLHKIENKNKTLQKVIENLVKQQKAYHCRVQDLIIKFEEMASEREKMRLIFVQQSSNQQQNELDTLDSFRNWSDEEERKFSQQVEQSIADNDADNDNNNLTTNQDCIHSAAGKKA